MSAKAASLIVIGGTIRADHERAPVQAFAIVDDRFAHVGSTAGALDLRGPKTEVLDLRGRTVLPGIVDAHLHLTSLGLTLGQLDLGQTQSYRELIARAMRFGERVAEGWIRGRGWDQTLWGASDFPSHDALSTAIPDRPVALTRVDGHALLANARAMALAGVDATTPDPPGGRIVRAADGRPAGVFVDAAMNLIYDKIPPPNHMQLVRATRAAIAECNRWGITAVGEPGCDEPTLTAHRELIERGEYSIRNYAMLSDDPALVATYERAGPLDAAYGGRLWIRAIKLYADGALGSRGAALLEPYHDDPENRGLLLTAPERIQSTTERALRTGFQACVHAIGDRANRLVLDAFERALRRAAPNVNPRLRVEHAQVVAPGDVARFAELQVIASVQASHALSDMRWAMSRLGPTRIRGAYAWRSLLDAGAVVANGTDAPVESASTPRTFYASIARAGWQTQERMSRREALASMTIWPAYANFQERCIGSIAPGKFADFVVMDRDWLETGEDEILETKILATYCGGRRVYGESP
jgi:predicted amidohydrolase YtcJ